MMKLLNLKNNLNKAEKVSIYVSLSLPY
jgi:hypothetical protein